jgi:vacuolar-type H+-ATPase subunit I/STV1
MRDYGHCPACGVAFRPGYLPRVYPTTCPNCGETLRLAVGHVWVSAILGAAASMLLSTALGFRGEMLWVIALAAWFPALLFFVFVIGLIRPVRYKTLSQPDRFDSSVSLFRKPRP